MATIRIATACGAGLLIAAGFMISRAQDPAPDTSADGVSAVPAELPVSDPSCTFFGPDREKYIPNAARQRMLERGRLTARVAGQLAPADQVLAAFSAAASVSPAALPSVPGGSRTDTAQHTNTIDKYIFQAMADAGVAPAPPTNDYEFIRRITLDLTGRIPTPDAVTSFVSDASLDKRQKMVDTLLASPEWVDKWTVWFGDFFQNNSQNTQINRNIQGVVAFNNYIRNSLTSGKPYDQMAREIISATGTSSYTQGELNFIVGGYMGGGPVQGQFDLQAANTAETFLGISHLNCLLCHNGRGHLDSLSLWGYYTTRQQAWGMASFMSRTTAQGTPNGTTPPWSVQNNRNVDYQLNTTTGNRPARCTVDANGRCVAPIQSVKPTYLFTGASPGLGTDYRAFLGQQITSDFQFARAAVNYMWEYFFGMGIVSPSDQFDPLRLDPDNPPADCPPASPCTLQPTNARLLNALAQDFINSGYDVKSLMREIVNSRAYQLSSRYDGTWDPNSQTLFARHMVRRLWSEEIADSLALSSGIATTYNNAVWGPVSWAMKLPEPRNTGGNGTAASAAFLDAFLRGNRDDQPRRGDGSISQALDLMNDNFVMQRVNSNNSASLIMKALALPASQNDQLVNMLFLNVLSRYPTQSEMSTALQNLQNPSTRTQEARYLYWSLYNKVDFVFNY